MDRLSELSYNFFCKMNKEKIMLSNLRGMDTFMLDYFTDKPLVGVEVGVYRGHHSFLLLKHLNIEKLYLVDPYEVYSDESNLGTEDNISKAFEFASSRLCDYKDTIEFVKLYSKEAVGVVPDGLDFVYIDANHSYDFVREDIAYWYSKVKPGGVIGGDNFEARYPGVARAVLEFVEDNNLDLKGYGVDWWVLKP